MNTFTLIFLAVLALTTLLRVWLAARQMRHVQQNRGNVPAAFVNQISLEQHQKAADYAVAKSRFSLVQIALEVAVVLGFTLAGGIDSLARFWSQHVDQSLVGNVALIGSVIVLTALIELPLDLYRKFKLEQRFGFNTMAVPQFLKDMLMQLVLGGILGLPLLFASAYLSKTAALPWC